jgi:hypothetical protein
VEAECTPDSRFDCTGSVCVGAGVIVPKKQGICKPHSKRVGVHVLVCDIGIQDTECYTNCVTTFVIVSLWGEGEEAEGWSIAAGFDSIRLLFSVSGHVAASIGGQNPSMGPGRCLTRAWRQFEEENSNPVNRLNSRRSSERYHQIEHRPHRA